MNELVKFENNMWVVRGVSGVVLMQTEHKDIAIQFALNFINL